MSVEYVMPVIASESLMPSRLDRPAVTTGVKEWRLDKFDGDPPGPGETKIPVEYITGGDELPTRRFVRVSCGETFTFTETTLEENSSGSH